MSVVKKNLYLIEYTKKKSIRITLVKPTKISHSPITLLDLKTYNYLNVYVRKTFWKT